jgi:glycosyltransferase involved in cell wall biosynthesis
MGPPVPAHPAAGAPTAGCIRLVRVIARLNVGGPTIQAITLTRLLESRGYATTLVHGVEGPSEGNMRYLAERLAVHPRLIKWLRPTHGPHDLPALPALMWTLWHARPHIVHTHAAKGGALGRAAARICARQAVLVHTFHGHSLRSYFSPRRARLYAQIERILARRTTALIAVSEEVRDELVELGVAPRERFEVVPLGFDLSAFDPDPPTRARGRAAIRAELEVAEGERVVTLIARLVPIKRVDRFLRVAGAMASQPGVRFVVVGDGELRWQLQRSAEAKALGSRLTWMGFRRDIADVCFASDVVVLTSDNEGTPVSLIEAHAAGLPVVATAVGGVRSVVEEGVTGYVVEPTDEQGFADAVLALLGDPERARAMGEAGRARVAEMFSLERLVDHLDALYRRLLGSPPPPAQPLMPPPAAPGDGPKEAVLSRSVIAPVLLVALVLLAMLPAQAAARERGVFLDPRSPVDKEYSLALDAVRAEAAKGLPGFGGTPQGGVTSGRLRAAPLLGVGLPARPGGPGIARGGGTGSTVAGASNRGAPAPAVLHRASRIPHGQELVGSRDAALLALAVLAVGALVGLGLRRLTLT